MKINDIEYLDEPVEFRGAYSLYPKLFPMRGKFYIAMKELKHPPKNALILSDADELARKKSAGVELIVIAVGAGVEGIECGDNVLPAESAFDNASTLHLKDGVSFIIGREQYVDGIFRDEESDN